MMLKNIMRQGLSLMSFFCLVVILSPAIATATVSTVEEQEQKYKYAVKPSEKIFIQKSISKDTLIYNAMAGVIQGVDTNPLLDATKKADSYTQELVDIHFKYPLLKSSLGATTSRFGFNVNNINYYRITDVNIFDGVADAGLEHEIRDGVTLNAGYQFEMLWFPHNRDGTFVGNEMSTGIKQKLLDWVYHKFTYKLLLKNYTHRKKRLGNANLSSKYREDARNTFEYELGVYIGKNTKFRIYDQYYINDSNDQYMDYYDYINNKVGVSMIYFLTRKLYSITGFYYQRRDYLEREVSDRNTTERDNLYVVSTSLMYDISKNISVFINYSHTENHTNEPLEKYVDTLYTTGLYYSF